MVLVLDARWETMERAISSVENPLSGYPLSKCLRICSSTPASELLRQFTYTVSMALPDLDMYSARSELNLDAVAVFPVPTLPVRYAVHARPDSASGLNRVSSLDICSSLCTRFLGT